MAKKRKLNIIADDGERSGVEEQINNVFEQKEEKQSAKVEIEEKIPDSEIPFSERADNQTERKSEVIDLNAKESKTDNKAVVDFTDQKFIDDLVSKKTKKVEDPLDNVNDFKNKSKEEIANDIKNAENSGNDMSPEDIYNVADIIITILDTFLANAMRIYAKDTSDSAYSLNDKKRKHLVKLLASILVKYQAKLKTEFIFIFALILYYAAPVLAARSRRKEIKLYNERLAQEKANGQFTEDNIEVKKETKDDVITPEVIEETPEVFYPEVIPQKLKRKKGRTGGY